MTDWNAECALRIEYIKWRVDNNELPSLKTWLIRMGVLSSPMTPEDIYKIYTEVGIMYVTEDQSENNINTSSPSYQEWLEQIKL